MTSLHVDNSFRQKDDPARVWPDAPARPSASGQEVHVWLARLAQVYDRLDMLEQTLSADEVERAARFYFQRDRLQFIAARGVLRNILARYLQVDPAQVRFTYSEHGKPVLEAAHRAEVQFNASRTQGVALYAVTAGRQVGVDVEQIRRDVDIQMMAWQFFAPAEYNALMELPPDRRWQAFFAAWTRKEAYLKARGIGLSLSPRQVTVSLLPDEPARLVEVENQPAEAGRWTLVSPVISPDYAAAVAVEGAGWRLHCWRWSP